MPTNFLVSFKENSFELKIRLLKFQTKDDIKKIFSIDFDVEYFIKIIETLDFLYQEKIFKEKQIEELVFIINFLKSWVILNKNHF